MVAVAIVTSRLGVLVGRRGDRDPREVDPQNVQIVTLCADAPDGTVGVRYYPLWHRKEKRYCGQWQAGR
jgi:hypothetical protein